MSENTVALNTGKQAIVNTDTSKIFIWDNRYINGTYNNPGYDPITLTAGTLMGRVSATQKVVPCDSVATDGSQFPIGILADDYYLVDEGADTVVSICNYGDVNSSKVIFADGDTFDTIVSSRSFRDRISSDTAGIRLIETTEMTAYDNQ